MGKQILDTAQAERGPKILKGPGSNALGAQFDFTSWLLFGALLQLSLTSVHGLRQYAAFPALALISYRAIRWVIEVVRYKPGSDGSILHKTTANFEDAKKQDGKITILLLKARAAGYVFGAFVVRTRKTES